MKRIWHNFFGGIDIWRVNQIRNIHNVIGFGRTGANYRNYSLWETMKCQSSAAILREIKLNLNRTTVTVVLLGADTGRRPWVLTEIEETLKLGNGLVGIQIHELRDRFGYTGSDGPVPYLREIGSTLIFITGSGLFFC